MNISRRTLLQAIASIPIFQEAQARMKELKAPGTPSCTAHLVKPVEILLIGHAALVDGGPPRARVVVARQFVSIKVDGDGCILSADRVDFGCVTGSPIHAIACAFQGRIIHEWAFAMPVIPTGAGMWIDWDDPDTVATPRKYGLSVGEVQF